MPNQLSFEVEFTRDQIQGILSNPSADYIVVFGEYEYRPDLGTNVWKMVVEGKGADSNKNILPSLVPVYGCIRPCP